MENKRSRIDYIKIVAEIILIFVTIYFGYIVTFSIKDKEIKLETLKVAIDILDKNPTNADDPLREWAIEVFEKYADPKPSQDVLRILKEKSLKGYITDEEGHYITDDEGHRLKAE